MDTEEEMITILQILQIASGLIIILLVLLHSPKGDGIAGIGDAANIFSSQKGVESGLNKLTGFMAGFFIIISIALGTGVVQNAIHHLHTGL